MTTLEILETIAIFVGLLYFIIKNIDKFFEGLSTLVGKIRNKCNILADNVFIGRIVSKGAIQKKLRRVLDNFDLEMPGLFPKSIRLTYIKHDIEKCLNREKALIVVQDFKFSEHTALQVTNEIVKRGCLPLAMNALHDIYKECATHVITSRILRLIDTDIHLSKMYFIEFIMPLIGNNKYANLIFNKFKKLDEQDMLMRLYLYEISTILNNNSSLAANDDFKNECREYVLFLYNIANKEITENVPLDYIGNYIKVQVVLVASEKKLKEEGALYYTRFANRGIKRGAKTVYMLAVGLFCKDARKAGIKLVSLGHVVPIHTGISMDIISGRHKGKIAICLMYKVKEDT
jgi:hypothetical protein